MSSGKEHLIFLTAFSINTCFLSVLSKYSIVCSGLVSFLFDKFISGEICFKKYLVLLTVLLLIVDCFLVADVIVGCFLVADVTFNAAAIFVGGRVEMGREFF